MTKEEMQKDLEVAKKIQVMVEKFGGDKTALARSLGLPNARLINKWLSLLDIEPKALKLLYEGSK